jgi:hypothetical protein
MLFIVQQDRRPAIGAGAQLQRAVRVVLVERLARQLFRVIHRQIGIIEKRHMRRLLASHAFSDVTMAGVVINRRMKRRHMNMRTTAGQLV